jgi:hypothetical protein
MNQGDGRKKVSFSAKINSPAPNYFPKRWKILEEEKQKKIFTST